MNYIQEPEFYAYPNSYNPIHLHTSEFDAKPL